MEARFEKVSQKLSKSSLIRVHCHKYRSMENNTNGKSFCFKNHSCELVPRKDPYCHVIPNLSQESGFLCNSCGKNYDKTAISFNCAIHQYDICDNCICLTNKFAYRYNNNSKYYFKNYVYGLFCVKCDSCHEQYNCVEFFYHDPLTSCDVCMKCTHRYFQNPPVLHQHNLIPNYNKNFVCNYCRSHFRNRFSRYCSSCDIDVCCDCFNAFCRFKSQYDQVCTHFSNIDRAFSSN